MYAILGLDGDIEHKTSMQRFVYFAHQLGFKLFYTETTLVEFEKSLKSVCDKFNSRPMPIYPTKPSRRSNPGLQRAYLLARASEGLSPNEFYHRFRDPTELLSALNIFQDSHADNEISKLVNSDLFVSITEAVRAQSPDKDLRAVAHDAALIAFVKNVRAGKRGIAKARVWFATLDRTLPYLNRALSNDLPLVVTIDQWIAMFRGLVRRVPDFDAFFADVVVRRILPSFYLDPNAVLKFQALLPTAGRNATEVFDRVISMVEPDSLSIAAENSTEERMIFLKTLTEQDQEANRKAQIYVKEKDTSIELIKREHLNEVSLLKEDFEKKVQLQAEKSALIEQKVLAEHNHQRQVEIEIIKKQGKDQIDNFISQQNKIRVLEKVIPKTRWLKIWYVEC